MSIPVDNLTEYCSDPRNIRFTRVNTNTARFFVNYASDCAAETTCMALIVVRSIFAGMFSVSSLFNITHLGF